MADSSYVKFNKRLRKIDGRHRKQADGYVQMVERDGILVPKSRRSARRRNFPFRGVLLTLAVFFVLKGLMLAHFGPTSYGERVEKLARGSAVEQAGAWAMQADPATVWIADQISPFL